MDIVARSFDAARARCGSIVLPEGRDDRIVAAARRLVDERLAKPVVLGTPGDVAAAAETAHVSLDGITQIDPADSDRFRLTPPRIVKGDRSRNRSLCEWSRNRSALVA